MSTINPAVETIEHYGPYVVSGKPYNVSWAYYRVQILDTRDTWIHETWECGYDEDDYTPDSAWQEARKKASELQAVYDKEQASKERATRKVRELERGTDGMLPSYAWPGGYPLFYVDGNGSVLCAECATHALDDKEEEVENMPQAYDNNYEDSSLYCAYCDKRIESAYAEEEEEMQEDVQENYPTVSLDSEDVPVSEPWELERVQVSFPDAENGYQSVAQEARPLGWVNSAAIELKREEDSVTLSISVGDPRGAFTLTVRRLSDGSLVMHVPHPDESLLHMPLTPLPTGTYRIG